MCCGIAQQCRRVLLCSFAVGCEDSEDTGFCPLRIMWCAPEHSIFSICRFLGKAATARKPSKIKGYSDFMIFPQNKKNPPNLVLGDFFMFLGTFLGNRRGRCLPSQTGRNGENKYSFTEIGKLVFYSNLFPDFF